MTVSRYNLAALRILSVSSDGGFLSAAIRRRDSAWFKRMVSMFSRKRAAADWPVMEAAFSIKILSSEEMRAKNRESLFLAGVFGFAERVAMKTMCAQPAHRAIRFFDS